MQQFGQETWRNPHQSLVLGNHLIFSQCHRDLDRRMGPSLNAHRVQNAQLTTVQSELDLHFLAQPRSTDRTEFYKFIKGLRCQLLQGLAAFIPCQIDRRLVFQGVPPLGLAQIAPGDLCIPMIA